MKHVLSLFDLTTDEILAVLKKSSEMKMALEAGERPTLLKGMNLAMLFQKQSLRTRVSFEAGMVQLGGNAMYLGADVGWGKRESVKDFSEVLSQKRNQRFMFMVLNTHWELTTANTTCVLNDRT